MDTGTNNFPIDVNQQITGTFIRGRYDLDNLIHSVNLVSRIDAFRRIADLKILQYKIDRLDVTDERDLKQLFSALYELEYKYNAVRGRPFGGMPQRKENILDLKLGKATLDEIFIHLSKKEETKMENIKD